MVDEKLERMWGGFTLGICKARSILLTN
jgi:hypothetical protein